ncbi:hypothetical protein FisN_27Lh048 [Fistulifera solaris]|uniref:Uncharacterized protein n=1 Tax=Fistulifera solaris TaxID=1519565 RepID=A0A1Z5JHS6_FISSO|nr:hypothetical protein FisN_27Lh048 [Fistulifera solaris]|eukprot:GAX13550.1 hypothetical protein FisN_27Lh048 [Fistulifera solaris]
MDHATAFAHHGATPLSRTPVKGLLRNRQNDSNSFSLFQAFMSSDSIDLMYKPSKPACNFPEISWDDDESDYTSDLSSFELMVSPCKRRKTTRTGMVRSKSMYRDLSKLTHHYSVV